MLSEVCANSCSDSDPAVEALGGLQIELGVHGERQVQRISVFIGCANSRSESNAHVAAPGSSQGEMDVHDACGEKE